MRSAGYFIYAYITVMVKSRLACRAASPGLVNRDTPILVFGEDLSKISRLGVVAGIAARGKPCSGSASGPFSPHWRLVFPAGSFVPPPLHLFRGL